MYNEIFKYNKVIGSVYMTGTEHIPVIQSLHIGNRCISRKH